MNTRLEAALRRDEADVLDACAAQQDNLAAAKAAYTADPTPENLAARQAAEQEMHEFRAWLRSGRPVIPDGTATNDGGRAARPSGRTRRDA